MMRCGVSNLSSGNACVRVRFFLSINGIYGTRFHLPFHRVYPFRSWIEFLFRAKIELSLFVASKQARRNTQSVQITRHTKAKWVHLNAVCESLFVTQRNNYNGNEYQYERNNNNKKRTEKCNANEKNPKQKPQ